MKNVLLIEWSMSAHLAALREMLPQMNGELEVVLADETAHAVLKASEYLGIQTSVCLDPVDNPRDLTQQLQQKKAGVTLDAVIVATPPIAHYDYVKWALSRGIPTLVDKPLTVVRECTTKPKAALRIVKQYEELCKLAKKNKVLDRFAIPVQKRYQVAYKTIAEKVSEVYQQTRYPVTFVQIVTNDGWRLFPNEFPEKIFHSLKPEYGGGKLCHSGYHFLDIATWIMRHAGQNGEGCAPIDHAWVTAHAFRPYDSAKHYPERTKDPDPSLKGYSDYNAYVLVELQDASNVTQCVIQFTALHEGLSRRGSKEQENAEACRTKIDTLMLFQGPMFFASLRRIAKITGIKNGAALGDDRHLELQFAYCGAGGTGRVEEFDFGKSAPSTPGMCGDDSKATLQFLDAVIGKKTGARIMSLVRDHEIVIKILAAAYESMAIQYCRGRPKSVRVCFTEGSWNPPR